MTQLQQGARDIPIGALVESSLNPRKTFDEQKLKELANTIASHGVIEPIVVRPHKRKADHFEIIAGARRFRGSRIAGKETVPAIVKELDDKAVLEIMVIENDQRDDVHPLEQSEGYARLLKEDGYTVEVLASKISKEAGYVYRRLQLLQLADKLKEEFRAGKFPYTHAVLLSRIAVEDQLRARKEVLYSASGDDYKGGEWVERGTKKACSKLALDSWIRKNVYLDLASASFPKDDATLVPRAGTCLACPKRTGANLKLFSDFKPGDDRCLDRKCFEAKVNQFVNRTIKQAEDSPLVKIALGHFDKDRLQKLPAGTLAGYGNGSGPNAFHLIRDSKPCKSAEPALILHNTSSYGPQKGIQAAICRDKNCATHAARYHHVPTPESKADRLKAKFDQQIAVAKMEAREEAEQKARLAALKWPYNVMRLLVDWQLLEQLGTLADMEAIASYPRMELEGYDPTSKNASALQAAIQAWVEDLKGAMLQEFAFWLLLQIPDVFDSVIEQTGFKVEKEVERLAAPALKAIAAERSRALAELKKANKKGEPK